MTDDRYAFESALYETLEFMPLAVRYRLDLVGMKLSLAAWQALPRDEREALCALPVETDAQRAAYAARVERDGHVAGVPASRIAPTDHPWASDVARGAVIERARELGATVDPARWQGLDDARRYVIHRLCSPVKDEAKFLAALAEFGLT